MRIQSGVWSGGLVRALARHGREMEVTTSRLSSGVALQRAADNPGKLGAGIRFATQVLSTRMAIRNISDGQSLMNVADAALGEVSSLLQRARQLAVSASNGSISDAERASFHKELVDVRRAIDDVAANATFNGRRVFGAFGQGVVTLREDTFNGASGVDSLMNTAWQSDRIGLASNTQSVMSTTGVGATSSQAMATAITDTFATLSKVDAGLTTALVDTIGGLVRLSQAVTLRGSDSFTSTAGTDTGLTTASVNTVGGYVTQGVGSSSLWSDSFADLSGINGGLTTAVINGGKAYLPTAFGGALLGTPGWQLGQVLNQRFFDTFTSTAGTNGLSSTATVDTVLGQVLSGNVTNTLWSATPNFQLSGSAPSWISAGTDTFIDLSQIASSTGLNIDTVAGTVQLLSETFTAASDTFSDLTRVNTVQTTAKVDTSTGSVRLNTSTATETFNDTFTDTSKILSSSGVNVDTTAGTVSLGTSAATLKTDTFTDSTGVGASSTGVVVSGGQLQLDQTAQLNNKQGTTAVFNPGVNNNFDARGVISSSVVDLGGGNLRMYYVTGKNANYTVGYTTSSDGGKTWGTGTNLNITGVTANSEITVTRDDTGTYYMFYSDGNNVYRRSSTNGTTGWSAQATATTRGTYTSIGQPTIVKDASGTYRMFVEVNNGGTSQIEQLSATALNGAWSQVAGWTNKNGKGPQIVNEGNRYSLYYKDNATGNIVRETSTDLMSFSGATNVITKGASGWDTNAVDTGGAVYDTATGVTRMLYLGKSTAAGEWSAGLAYTTARTSGTFVSTVTNTTDTIKNLTLNATANTTGGTITYRVSADNGTTWQTITSGSNISVAAGQQLLVEATLTNTQGVNGGGPTLQDYTLSANLFNTSGSFTTTAHTFAAPVDNFTFTPNATAPAGTAISYEYSLDGSTWTAFTAGSQVTLGTTTSQVQVRANFSTADRGFAPTLGDYTISATRQQYNASEYLYTQNYTLVDSIDAFTLSATQSGTVGWEYSTDGGATWQTASLGNNSLGGPVSQLQLRAQLQAGGGGTTTPVISDYSVTASRYQATGSFVSKDFTFSSAVNKIKLTANASTPGGSSINYEISTDGGTTWQAVTNGGAFNLGAATNSVKVRATLNSTDQYYTPTLNDFTIEGYTTGYAASGTYTSTVQNFGYNVQNVTLDVVENKPSGTNISYELSTDGGSTWQAITPGSNVAVSPDQNLMLRANLSTSDTTVTPQLISYTLKSNQKQASTVWQSVTTTLGANASAVKLSTTQSTPAGTSISYEVSADNGATWTSVSAGAITNLGTAGNQLVVRATLNSSDPYATASLQDLKLETYDYETTNMFTSSFQTLSAATNQVRLASASSTLPGGTNVTYEVTNDGGTTWMAVTPGSTATFGSAGTQIGFRSTLTGDGSATPTVNSFALEVPGYESGHYVYSTVHNLGYSIDNVTLNATENKPGGTDITYELSTDGGVTWSAITAGSNTAVTAGSSVVLRAKLSSSSANLTPELLDYSLTTNQPTGSDWYSTVMAVGSNVSQVRLNVNENKPAGTNITYQLSSDGGSTWQAITPGSFVSVTPGQNLVLKASFSSSNPATSVAKLLDYTLETRDYSGPATMTSKVTDIGHDVTQLKLDVNANVGAGTGISYELSNDGGTTWVAATPGSVVNFGSAGRQVAMRATLTGTNTASPELLDYTISAPMYQSTVVYSALQNLATPISNITLNTTANKPAGTAITYEVSADGGSTWQTVTPGVNATLTTPGNLLQMRATLTSSDGRNTAQLVDWSATTEAYQTSGTMTTTIETLPFAVDKLKFMANYLLNGGSMSFELSNDGGATWVAAAPGNEVSFGSAGTKVALRATFSGTGSSTPQLLDYRLDGKSNSAPIDTTFRVMSGPNGRATVEMKLPSISSAVLGLNTLDIQSSTGALGAQRVLDEAISTVLRARGEVGATASSLQFEMNRQTAYEVAMVDAKSRIIDADMALESLAFVRSNLAFQSGAQIMAAGLDGRRNAISVLLSPLSQAGDLRPPMPDPTTFGVGLPGFSMAK